jgi:hypothetical protein
MGRDPVTRSRPLLGLVVIAMTLALPGCADPRARDDAGVRDDEILQAIEDLEGVEFADVEFDNSFGYGSRYRGDVEVTVGADAGCVLVQTMGLLKQGRPGVALSSVAVRQGDVTLTLNDLTPEQVRVVDAATTPADGRPVVPVC